MLTTVTLMFSGSVSLILSASSSALASSGFRMLGTPSLINDPVSGLILISFVSGTCFAQTTILNAITSYPPYPISVEAMLQQPFSELLKFLHRSQ